MVIFVAVCRLPELYRWSAESSSALKSLLFLLFVSIADVRKTYFHKPQVGTVADKRTQVLVLSPSLPQVAVPGPGGISFRIPVRLRSFANSYSALQRSTIVSSHF